MRVADCVIAMTSSLTSGKRSAPAQSPFARVAPLLRAALLLGAGGGFALAALLTTSQALGLPLGVWWLATAQAHGHLQVYGWAGLFVLGVATHFLPRLRGAPLAHPRLIPWCLGLVVAGLLARALGQPLMALMMVHGDGVWRAMVGLSGIAEALGYLGLGSCLALTLRAGPPLATRKAFRSVLPLLAGALTSLEVAALVNCANTLALGWQAQPVVGGVADELNITLGLFGFLVPMALAMSAQSLPLYAGLEPFPRQMLWPLAGCYFGGLVAFCAGMLVASGGSALGPDVEGLGLLAMGAALLTFIGVFLRMMRGRRKLPEKVTSLAPAPAVAERRYAEVKASNRKAYGPFVGLVASAYLWALLAGVLILTDGGALLVTGDIPFALDAVRHALAIGFIALLICGLAPRMVPAFSGGHIASPRYVTATLWLGNVSAVLRVGSILAAPLLVGGVGSALDNALFGLSGPTGLALAICLALNLWPALRGKTTPQPAAVAGA